jgi:hypothetical protein
VFYGVSAVLLLVFGVLMTNFAMIPIRALFSGAKVTLTSNTAFEILSIDIADGDVGENIGPGGAQTPLPGSQAGPP